MKQIFKMKFRDDEFRVNVIFPLCTTSLYFCVVLCTEKRSDAFSLHAVRDQSEEVSSSRVQLLQDNEGENYCS